MPRFSQVTPRLPVTDLRRTMHFYGDHLGFEVDVLWPSQRPTFAILRRDGEDVAPRHTFAFLEVNTRLQVEHPVTEETVRVRDPATGGLERLDLVRLQIELAAGAPLPFSQDDLVRSGHAIEARLYAEDPAAGHLPATGRLAVFDPATGPGIQASAMVAANTRVHVRICSTDVQRSARSSS